jgi:hypothetical protein
MKKYLIFLDILGFDELPKELAKKSGFQEDFIREKCLSNPLKRVIEELKNEQGIKN